MLLVLLDISEERSALCGGNRTTRLRSDSDPFVQPMSPGIPKYRRTIKRRMFDFNIGSTASQNTLKCFATACSQRSAASAGARMEKGAWLPDTTGEFSGSAGVDPVCWFCWDPLEIGFGCSPCFTDSSDSSDVHEIRLEHQHHFAPRWNRAQESTHTYTARTRAQTGMRTSDRFQHLIKELPRTSHIQICWATQ